jgi:SAM-dependent methyltransferase
MRGRRIGKLPAIWIRRRFYVERAEPIPRAVARLRRLIDDDPAAVGSRRIKIGGGWYPTPGYIHVDSDLSACHLEYRAQAWELPFPDNWAEELTAIHVLEHILPSKQGQTLAEWHRVLQPGGRLRVHVPNAPAIMRAYLESDRLTRWRMSGALLGQYCGPELSGPESLNVRSDHQVLFDSDMLGASLLAAGFVHPVDTTLDARDRHSARWQEVVPNFSLAFTAQKAAASSPPTSGERRPVRGRRFARGAQRE